MTTSSSQIVIWIDRAAFITLHDIGLRRFGGLAGMRDEGLLDSALARPQNMAAYTVPDLSDLAAAYAFGLAKNHPFIDGNKRAAFMAATLFLHINGFNLVASEVDAALQTIALAAGHITEADYAAWLKKYMVQR
jgi:death-on-curing protein